MVQPVRIAAYTAITAGALFGAYAIYFDYRRRNDPAFRKAIRSHQKQAKLATEAEEKAEKAKLDKELRTALAGIANEDDLPVSPEQQEAYFQEQVAEGEKLATMGRGMAVTAAMHFYRALRVYPNPVELLMIYQKVVPDYVFGLIIQAMELAPEGRGGAGGPGSGLGGNPLAALGGLGAGSSAGGAGARVSEIDIDEVSSSHSSNGASTSEWDRLSQEA